MMTFSIICVQYLASDHQGKKVSGKVFALSLQDANQQLTGLGLSPHKLKSRQWKPPLFNASALLSRPQLNHFSKQLATLLSSSVSLEQALKIMQRTTPSPPLKIVICKIQQAISYGLPLSESLRLADTCFSGFYANLVATAEQHGDLGKCFDELAVLQEKRQRLKQRIRKMLIYPCLVSTVALIVSYVMLTQVIPEFEKMFISLGGSLPTFTQNVLSLSHWIQQQGPLTALCFALMGVIATSLYKYNAMFQYQLDSLSLNLPVIGKTLHQVAQCRLCQTVAVTLAAGLPIVQCFKSAKATCTNRKIERRIGRAIQYLESGHSLTHSLTHVHLLDATLLQLVAIGEHSGQLEKMLNHASLQLTASIDDQVDNIGQLIEPIMIVVLGTLVGGLVVAMYLPIFQLMNHLG